MPISQLTQSPKDWQKYRKRKPFRHKNRGHAAAALRSFARGRKTLIKKAIAWLFVLGIIGLLVGGIIFIGAWAWYSHNLPDPNKVIDRVIAESTKIYDRTGKILLYEIHGDQKRTVVDLDQISNYIKWATISAEDKTFYQHKGFKITSIIRSIIVDVLSGSASQGGSTITQQFIKNAILNNDKTFGRKFKELILAYQIEKKFTKDQILKLYFNEIPYGSVNYGVESAANFFFGKSAKDVTLAEAAILAALPKSPTHLSPYGSHQDELFIRQKWILDEMVKDGYITKADAENAKKEKIEFKKEALAGITAPHFVFYVKELLAEKLGEKAIEQGGLKVITTLDVDKQKIAEDAVHNAKEKNLTYKATNAALVSLDAKTGEILAMVGSQDFTDETIDGQVNVTIMPRQPGSSIKPVVYAAAFEKGFTPDTILYDVDTIFAKTPKVYEPHDYDKKERGPITMRNALAGSLNIPAVKTLYLAGYENVKDLLQRMGYSTITPKSDCGLALVLGGCEVKLLDHTGAFTAFARDGQRAEPAAILSVEDKTGKVLDEFQPQIHKVLSEQSVRQINSILTDANARAFIFGAAPSLLLPNRPVGAKTGTTNDNNDAWTIGFTPSFVTGVWVGNSDGADMTDKADGVNVAAPIWHEYMSKILQGTPVEYFQAPDPPADTLPPILRGIAPSNMEVEIDRASGKLATPLTPDSFRVKKTFNQNHDILYYINKDNPTGPPPTNPADDPMFQFWEDGVQKWAEKVAKENNSQVSTEVAPTEYDDLHVLANSPTLTLIAPTSNQTINASPVDFQVLTSAPRGLSRVAYELDGKLIGVTRATPYNLQINLTDFANGFHHLKVTAFDDIDNAKSVEIDLNLMLSGSVQNLNWLSPSQESTFHTYSFPLTITLRPALPGNLNKITIYYQLTGGSSTQKIAELIDVKDRDINIVWPSAPAPGHYEIYGVLETKDGSTTESPRLNITVSD